MKVKHIPASFLSLPNHVPKKAQPSIGSATLPRAACPSPKLAIIQTRNQRYTALAADPFPQAAGATSPVSSGW